MQLLGHAQNMGIVLREFPHAGKPVQHAGLFMPVDRAELEIPQGQVLDSCAGASGKSACGPGSSWASGRIFCPSTSVKYMICKVIMQVTRALPQVGLEVSAGPLTMS